MIKTILFDVGETLLRAHPSFVEKFSEVLKEIGRSKSIDEIQKAEEVVKEEVDKKFRQGETYSLSAEQSRNFWVWFYSELLNNLSIKPDAKTIDVFIKRFSDPDSYMLYDDALQTIEALKNKNLTIGVVSNFEEWCEELLEKMLIKHLLDFVVVSANVGFEKPDIRIFKEALRLSKSKPDETIHVGDNPYADVGGAAKIGIYPVLIDRFNRYPEINNVTKIASLKEILSLEIN